MAEGSEAATGVTKEEEAIKLVSPPDRRTFEKTIANITRTISEKQKLINPQENPSVSNKRITDQLHIAGTKLESAEEERNKLMAELKSTDEKIRKLGGSYLKQREECNHLGAGLKYKTEEMYGEQIKKLESQLQSSHFSLNDRRKLQLTIEGLKEGKDKLKDYLAARESMDKIRHEQDQERKHKDMIHLKNKLCREKITALRDEISKLREELENNKTLQREKKSVQEGVTKEINDLYQQRKQLKDEFRQKEAEYVEYLKLTKAKKPQPHDKPTERKVAQSNRQTLKVEAMQKEVLFEEERGICQTLVTYLSRLTGASPMLSSSFANSDSLTHSGSPTTQSPETTPSLPVRSSTSDGSYHRKNEEEEEWIPAGHHRKDRRKSKRRKSFSGPKTLHKPLHHNATIFEQFSLIGLRPPITSAEIEMTLNQLRDKLIQYELMRSKAESEAGDSGIMSSTGISEFSDIGNNDIGLTSGEVTPIRSQTNNSPSPTPVNNGQVIRKDLEPDDQPVVNV